MEQDGAPRSDPSARTIKTADGVMVGLGDRVFNYYDMRIGNIVSEPDTDGGFAGWFDFQADDRPGTTILNGERICTLAHARRMGWLDAR